MKNEVSRLKILLLLVLVTITMSTFAQSIYDNPITGANPSNNNPYNTGQTIVTGITSTGIGYGSGANNSNANNRYNTSGYSTNGTLTIGNNDFISWTITPGNCYDLDFTSLVIAYERSLSGPQNLALRSSIDAYATNIWTITGILEPEQTSTIPLTAAAFQNLTTAVTFRLYGWSSTSTNGTFSINSFIFNGAVTSTNTAVAGTISGINSVCSGSNTTLTVSGNTGNIQWQTSTDNITFTNITGATSATYTTPNLTAITYYRAALTAGTCPTVFSSSYTVGITTPSFTAVNGSRCGSGTVGLSVNNVCPPSGSTTNWYAASTGGTSLGTGNTFTTPVLNSTTTYYANATFNTGATLSTVDRSTTNQRGLRFNAISSFALNSVQINTNAAGSITLELRDNLNQLVAGTAAVVYTATAGTNTVPLGWTIPAGTGYRIIKTAGTPQLSRTDPFTFPIGTAGVVSITSSEDNGAVDNTRYFYFYNWNVSTTRIPVVATINAINPDVTTSACGTYTWSANGVTYNTSGVYYYVGTCNTATLNLTINPNTSNSTTVSACASYTWTVNGQTYTTSGTYTSVTGCNTETLVLTITPNTTPTTTITACDSYTWSVNGQTYTSSGTYTSVTGCTTNTLVLTINTSSTTTTTATACNSYTWSVNGTTYTTSGIYTFVNGCQTQNLDLTISTPSFTAVGATACAPAAVNLAVSQVCQPAGSTTNWYAASTGGSSLGTGNNYTTPVLNATTTYYASNNFTAGATLSTGNRSSTLNRGLVFNAIVPFMLNSVQINTNGAGSVTVELRNILNQPVAGAGAVVFTAAAGTNTVPLGWSVPAGTGYRILYTTGTIQLSRTDPFTFPIGTAGVLSITNSIDAGAVENTRYFYFYNWNVSLSRIPVVATMTTPTVPTFTQVSAICSGAALNALPTTSNNSITGTWGPALNNTATTTYTFTPTIGQCASTSTMTITVNPALTASVSIAASATTICAGTSVTFTATPTNGGTAPTYVWKKNGTTISGATASTYSTTSVLNNDVITCVMTSNATPCLTGSPATSNGVTMVVNPVLTASVSISASATGACQGSAITVTATPTNGGNSPIYVWKKNEAVVPGQNNSTFTSGSFVNGDVITCEMTSNATPCLVGSLAISNSVTIVLNPIVTPTFTQVSAICSGETLNALPTTSNNGITGTWSPALNNTSTTTYTFTPTAGQCASTETMTITVNPLSNNTTTVNACDSYTWSVNSTTYNISGTYTSVTGCHTETLVLTITPSTNNTTTASACDSYTWAVNGTTHYASGTYTSVTGCHTETLVLTITPSTSNTTNASSCDSYTWSVNGTTYTTSGTYTSVTGCNTETLVLTITPSTNNTTTASACDTYTWTVNGTAYTTSGTYTSVTGCHTEILVLTITPSTYNTTTTSACDSYTWSVNGTTYTTSGTYTSVTGCHTETLVLTVNASSVYYVDADGDGFGSTTTANFCTMPSTGYASNNTDCNDAVATTYPGAPELCNGVDDNCSGFADEGCPSTIAGEEPSNSILAPSGMYSYCSSFYGTLAGAFPSAAAQSSCVTGEDVWYNFVAQSSGVTIFIGSYLNDIVIELQDANGNLIEIENTVNGPGTEVLTTTNLIAGQEYRIGIRNKNSNVNPGGAFSACFRHLRRGGADSGTSPTWPSTLSTCSLFKASYCGGTGVQYRYTWTGISGTATGMVFTRTQTSDYLNVTALTPSLHAGSTYNVLVTAIYTIPNGAGVNEVVELTALAPSTITISPVANVALRSADQLSNGPRYRGSVVAALPWVCGVTNWRWRFTEVNPLTLQTVGLPIEQNRGAASNYINLNSVTALQYGKTYAVQSAPVFSYTGSNYQWGPVTYMAIIGSAGLIVDPMEGAAQGAAQDSPKDVAQDATASQDSPKDVAQGASQGIELSVFPNPSNGSDLNLNISGIESDNVQVKIYDAMGRKVESFRLVVNGNLQTQLPISNDYSNGMYMIEVSSDHQMKSTRVLISK